VKISTKEVENQFQKLKNYLYCSGILRLGSFNARLRRIGPPGTACICIRISLGILLLNSDSLQITLSTSPNNHNPLEVLTELARFFHDVYCSIPSDWRHSTAFANTTLGAQYTWSRIFLLTYRISLLNVLISVTSCTCSKVLRKLM
jgi:hypothetical protein